MEPAGGFRFIFRDNENRQQNVSLHEYWTIRPTLLNHFRASYTRSDGSRTLRSEPFLTADDLGIPYSPLPAGPVVGAEMRVIGYFEASFPAGGPKVSNIYSVTDTVDWIKGRHSFKFGGEAHLRRLFDSTLDGRNGGEFRFNGTTTGNSMADFLLGEMSERFRYRTTTYKSNNQWAFYGFVQDNFRVNKRLTLNLGLRYEYDAWPVDPLDHIRGYEPGRESTCVPQAPRGFVFPCDEGVPRSTINADWDNFAPRLGFAYDLTGDGKTVIRGGYGLSYGVALFNALQEGLIGIPWSLIAEVRNTGGSRRPSTIKLANPWASVPGGNPFPFEPDPSNVSFPATAEYTAADKDLKRGYFHQYNLSIQRQFGDTTVIELAYVGSRGHDLLGQRDINAPVPSPNASAANIDARRPLIGDGITRLNQFGGFVRSWYDSLQARVEKRFGRGFGVLGSYTFGKAVDYESWFSSGSWFQDFRNPAGNKGLADFDRRHLLTVSWLWELPFFKDRKGVVETLLGGWQLNGIASYYSGQPVVIRTNRDNNFDGQSANDRPDLVGDLDKPRPANDEINAGATWFNTEALRPNQPGQFGNLGRNVAIGPGRKNVDLGLAKTFRINDRHRFQLRVDAFNVFNFVNFDNPVGELTSGNFGKIVSAGDARVIQLGVKYIF